MKTQLCGLLGRRLEHSFSPQIHAYLADYEYCLFTITPENVDDFIKNGIWDCLNVTIPYKETVIPYLGEISDEAIRIGSVNTIVKTPEGMLKGHNTDYYGFAYLLNRSGISVYGRKCVILGSGGSAKTVRCVLEDLGAQKIVTISRTGENNYGNIDRHADADIIVNTTPVGMYPDTGKSAIRLAEFPQCSGVLDLIYNPAKTKLLLDAERLGIRYANGLPMLVAQAKRACEIFTGKTIPDNVVDSITMKIEAETKNIILIGMPSCGKTSVGCLLAQKLGRRFVDIDEEITVRNNRTPSEIIREDGENVFRSIEVTVTADFAKESGAVIATGGGVVLRAENMDSLRQNGIIFFIERSPEKLLTANRPLSQSAGVYALYAARKPLYSALCDIKVDGSGTIAETVEKISLILEEAKI